MDSTIPLAQRMRPQTLEEFEGQEHLTGENKIVRQLLNQGTVPSLILWGPPGSGKTTLATLIAKTLNAHLISFAAPTTSVSDIKKASQEALSFKQAYQQQTIVFIDEIHRLNKAQQDYLLHPVEDGTFILIGTTTENPSFEVISPLLSRSRVLVLESLSEKHIAILLRRAMEDTAQGLGATKLSISQEDLTLLAHTANGDARLALNTLEIAATLAQSHKKAYIDREHIQTAFQKASLRYDREGEEHYNTISAFIKSMRGSDPDAAIYWLARMLEAGEDPLFIARRMVIFASEDIGNVDPQALQVAVSVMQAVHFVGLPEARITLAHGATYLASAPKSNASYVAVEEALADTRKHGNLPVPLHLRNAPTKLMQELQYGRGYRYPHDEPGGIAEGEIYLPEKLKGKKYYRVKRG